jgi:hypothetical protein
MTNPKYSVILPHVSVVNGQPNTCIDLCRHLLHKAATMPFEIIDVVDYPDYYTATNEGVLKANSDIVITFNDDMFPEPGWDKLLVENCKPDVVVTTRIIESGRLPVGHPNIEFNAGMSPETFEYDKFVNFVNDYKKLNNLPDIENGLGSGVPAAFYKHNWIPYPVYHCADMDYFFKILPEAGVRFVKANSFIYHIQSFTLPGGIKQ